jgi:hypothetical protein
MGLLHAGEMVLPFKKGGKNAAAATQRAAKEAKKAVKQAASRKAAQRTAAQSHRSTKETLSAIKRGPTVAKQLQSLQGFIAAEEAALELAKLSPDPADDIAHLQSLEKLQNQGLGLASRVGDLGQMSSFAQALAGTRGSLADLGAPPSGEEDPTDALIKEQNDLIQQQIDQGKAFEDAVAGLTTELTRTRKIAEEVGQSNEYQLRKLLGDIFSGQLGVGMVGRSFAAGDGTEWNY